MAHIFVGFTELFDSMSINPLLQLHSWVEISKEWSNENEAKTGLRCVAEHVIWKMKRPNTSSCLGVLFGWCNTSHLSHWGDSVTSVSPSGKKYKNPEKSISWSRTVTPRNIPGKEIKMMVCFGWQVLLPIPKETLEYLRCLKMLSWGTKCVLWNITWSSSNSCKF